MKNKLLVKGSALFALAMFFAMTHSMNAQYCVPEATNGARHISSFSTTEGSENISNLDSDFSADGYGDFYDTQSVSQVQGESINFSADIVGGTAGFRIWVDWNQDGEFDETEEVAYQSEGYSSTHSGSFSIPDGATPGETRMRIVSHWLSSSGDIDPCETDFSYGEFEDYKLEVIAPEECEGTPEAGIATVNPSTGNAESTYTVSAESYTNASEMSFQWQSNINEEGWEDEGDATETLTPYTATAPSEIGDEVEWRLALTCTVSEETEFSEIATFTTELTYCIPTGSSNNGDEILNFTLTNLNNDSEPSEGEDGYSNYSGSVSPAELEAGESYEASLTSGSGSGNHGAAIWIDYNQNGSFEEAEMVAFIDNSIGASTTVDFPEFTVPDSTLEGTYRLRVQYHYSNSGDSLEPCETTSSFSETEDYTVNIAGEDGGDNDTFPAPYCNIADAEDVLVEEITAVDFAGTSITNDDTDSVLINKTDTTIDVTAGETYTLAVEGNTYDTEENSFDSNIVAFVDWDQNETLDDTGEVYEIGLLSSSNGADGTSVSFEITIPEDATLGETRIRITKTYTDEDSVAEVNPCAIEMDAFGVMIVPGFGQALDFTLNIEESDGGGTVSYCTPELDCSDNDMITNVTFLEIDNTTTCSPDGYGDYTDMSASVEAGETYPISVSVGDGWSNESASVWIDFDNSGTFDEDEFFYIGTGTDEALTSEVSIPEGLADGDYRMRVRVAAVGEDTATWDMSCDETQAFGETEDYTVTVGTLGMDDNTIVDFTYYPNPMQDVLHITADLNIDSVSIYNVLGQEVLTKNHVSDNKLDVTLLPTGNYIFRITFDNGSVENFKAVKK